MSQIEDTVYLLIKKALPNYKCIRQHYVYYHRHKLFFDFYLPDLKTMIEVQGEQHFEFNKFYHSSANDFGKQKVRDKLKEEWCEENKYTLVAIKYDKIKSLTAIKLKEIIARSK